MRALWAALAAVLLLCAACGSEPAAVPTPPPHATAAPRPAASACYQLTYEQAVAPTASASPSDAVACTATHTSETFYVGALSTLVNGHLVAVDSKRVQRQSARTCPQKLSAFLGGNVDDLRLSMLRAVWFTPTVKDSDAGADWLRCDVIAVAGASTLASLTGSLKGALAKGSGDEAMCGTAAPGDAAFVRLPCAQPHTWRAVQVVPFSGDDYPGEAAAKAAGQTVCKTAGQDAAKDALDYQWSYEWPTAAQWDSGQTYGICWAPS